MERSSPVSAGPLLPEHQYDCKGCLVEHPLALKDSLELLSQRQLLVPMEVLHNLIKFLVDVDIVFSFRPDMSKRLSRIGDPVLLHQPSRRLILEEDADEKQHAGKHLQRKGYPPLCGVQAGDRFGDAVVDEVTEHDTSDIEELHASDATTTDLLVRILADIRRDNGGDQTDTKSTDNSADVELS